MASYTIVTPPLHEVRAAVWSRLDTDDNTSAYNLAKEGRPVEFPYLVVGSCYKGAQHTTYGWNVVVQIEAYAASTAGGSKQVSDMIRNVYEALSASGLQVAKPSSGYYDVPAPVVEEDVLTTDMVDPVTQELYAQRLVRLRFFVSE
jgi:hypothetical protein